MMMVVAAGAMFACGGRVFVEAESDAGVVFVGDDDENGVERERDDDRDVSPGPADAGARDAAAPSKRDASPPLPTPSPVEAGWPADMPPSSGVPCGPGALVEMAFRIPASLMSTGAGRSGVGYCRGAVRFRANLAHRDPTGWLEYDAQHNPIHHSGWMNGFSECTSARIPGRAHCSTVVFADGSEKEQYCSISALCENGVATATAFTW